MFIWMQASSPCIKEDSVEHNDWDEIRNVAGPEISKARQNFWPVDPRLCEDIIWISYYLKDSKAIRLQHWKGMQHILNAPRF